MSVTRLSTEETVNYGAHEIVALARITYRQLDHWTRAGYIKALPRPKGCGSGVPREYPLDQLCTAVSLACLLDAGFTFSHAVDHLGIEQT